MLEDKSSPQILPIIADQTPQRDIEYMQIATGNGNRRSIFELGTQNPSWGWSISSQLPRRQRNFESSTEQGACRESSVHYIAKTMQSVVLEGDAQLFTLPAPPCSSLVCNSLLTLFAAFIVGTKNQRFPTSWCLLFAVVRFWIHTSPWGGQQHERSENSFDGWFHCVHNTS